MIQRASAQYHARLFIKAEEGGLWHRHHQGAEPAAPPGVALGTRHIRPRVNDGRWVVECPDPSCGGAQLASPDLDRFFCVDCLNAAVDGHWHRVRWPKAKELAALDTALSARPDIRSRNWAPGESVGALLAENHEHGLVDVAAELVAGDIGYSGHPGLNR